MGNGCPGGSGGQGGAAGIGEKVQNFYGAACLSDFPGKPVLVYCLLWKKAGVFKAEGL